MFSKWSPSVYEKLWRITSQFTVTFIANEIQHIPAQQKLLLRKKI